MTPDPPARPPRPYPGPPLTPDPDPLDAPGDGSPGAWIRDDDDDDGGDDG